MCHHLYPKTNMDFFLLVQISYFIVVFSYSLLPFAQEVIVSPMSICLLVGCLVCQQINTKASEHIFFKLDI